MLEPTTMAYVAEPPSCLGATKYQAAPSTSRPRPAPISRITLRRTMRSPRSSPGGARLPHRPAIGFGRYWTATTSRLVAGATVACVPTVVLHVTEPAAFAHAYHVTPSRRIFTVVALVGAIVKATWSMLFGFDAFSVYRTLVTV